MCKALTLIAIALLLGAIGLLWLLHGVGQHVDKQKQDERD
jgi:nitrogen fixation-related uncharacterized protein